MDGETQAHIDAINARADRHEAGCEHRHAEILRRLDEGSRRFRRLEIVGALIAGAILAGEYQIIEAVKAVVAP